MKSRDGKSKRREEKRREEKRREEKRREEKRREEKRREEKRREEKRREEKRRRKRIREDTVRRKKIQVREKVGKSRNTVFFHWFVAPEGRKVGSLKRRVRSNLARWEMNNCTPLWREARLQKLKHLTFGALLEVEIMKKCTPLWREAHFEVKTCKAHRARTTFGSWHVEKVARSAC